MPINSVGSRSIRNIIPTNPARPGRRDSVDDAQFAVSQMAMLKSNRLACFVAIPFAPEFEEIRRTVESAIQNAGFRPVEFRGEPGARHNIRELLIGRMAQADCIVADLTDRSSNIYYELGLAQAMGKAIFPIVREDAVDRILFDVLDLQFLRYEPTKKGYSRVAEDLAKALDEFRRSPRTFEFLGSRVSTPFFVDWERLDQTDAENLCRELLSQMGLRQVDWFKDSREIDLVAEYPRKDPDGFEYRDLWLVSMGRAPLETLVEMLEPEPEYFLHHLFRDDERFERLMMSETAMTITLLVIALRGHPKELEIIRDRLSRRMGRRGRYPNIRVRLWDRDYVTSLVQQFPNIGYKYFSDEARSLSKFRKGPEELYQENLALTERLSKTLTDLQKEKNRRLRAERDAIWKDISFAAAHKIGNPIFAIETDLDPLQKRVNEDRKDEASEVISNIRAATEKAKTIVEQFKSLTKAQQVTPVPILLEPLLTDCCKILVASGVASEVRCPRELKVLGDPDRLSELFDELATNALHWLDKPDKRVWIDVSIAESSTLPSSVDSNRKYAVIHFRDNGPGVSFENKAQIFEAFFSTYEHGTGLGLALARRIIEGHGGSIRETGVPGQGADFELYIPVAAEDKK